MVGWGAGEGGGVVDTLGEMWLVTREKYGEDWEGDRMIGDVLERR